jgi:hypothetical protein
LSDYPCRMVYQTHPFVFRIIIYYHPDITHRLSASRFRLIIPDLITRRCGLQLIARPMIFCEIRLDCQMWVDGQCQIGLIVWYAIKCEEHNEEVIGSQRWVFTRCHVDPRLGWIDKASVM